MNNRKFWGISVIASTISILSIQTPAIAEDNPLLEYFEKTQVNGDIRSYYFTRDYTNPDLLNQSAYSLGGDIRFLTAPIYGFQVGAAYYTAQSLGLNSDNPEKVDQTLPGNDIGVLGQAYIQYQISPLLLRVGDQLINTPWMSAGDSRMIPATYRGVYSVWTPMPNWTITGLRMFEFKSRIADSFSATNLYNVDSTDHGDWAFGANYHSKALSSELWAYQFMDFGKLFYSNSQYTFNEKSPWQPLVGLQLFKETGDGDNVLQQVSSGKADSQGYGLLTGLSYDHAKLTVGYNQIFSASGAYKNGDIVSPYTTGYADDPLFTTSMIGGLVEKSSGQAAKITASYAAFQNDLLLSTSFAHYITDPEVPNTDETDLDVTYSFNHVQYLKGLSVRERLGVQTGDPAKGTFYYNRIMLQYSFQI